MLVSTSSLYQDESLLIRDLRAGLERATTFWFHQYEPRLSAYVARKLDKPLDAEEIVQEVFINCLKALPNFKGNSKLFTWMCSIANHEIADYFRKRYAKKFIHALPLADFLLGTDTDNSLKILDAHQTAETLHRVFSKIGHHYQELLLLKYVDQKKVKDIARQLGRSPKSIESDLFRARRDFREQYQRFEAESK